METTLTSAQLLVGHWQTVQTLPLSSGSVAYFYQPLYQIQKLSLDPQPLFTRVEMPAPFIVNDERALAQLYSEFAGEDREMAEMGLEDYQRLLAGADGA